MRVLLQRVLQAQVDIVPPEKTRALTSASERYTSGSIGKGLLLFVGFSKEDSAEKLLPMRDKLLGLRIFPNEEGKFDRSVSDIEGGEILIVSQFTLYGDCRKGRRP
ncbi:MAG: D-aminoacyl-tRNA deacylase, partial [Bdellovibrionota bacterium]